MIRGMLSSYRSLCPCNGGFSFGLLYNGRLGWCHWVILPVNIGLYEKPLLNGEYCLIQIRRPSIQACDSLHAKQASP